MLGIDRAGGQRSPRPVLCRAGLTAVLAAALIAGAGGAGPVAQGAADRRLAGFSASGAVRQLEVEEALASLLDRRRTGQHFRYLTEEPHPAGSQRNYELAVYLRDRFREYGLEEVRLHRYEVLLPWPRRVRVAMVEPYPHEATLREDGYPQDKDSYDSAVGIAYLGMSASGRVTGELIYAHSGNPEDYDWLLSQGIDPRGKVAIVRYSVPYSYRGFKAWEAQRRGVKALLIYSDPQEDGYRKGLTFPEGPWGPESHIQRGAITYDFLVPGDPLTPGWASVEGAERIPVQEARSVPAVIAVPLSYRDARPLLENLGGPVAPYSWQGGLPFTYRVGPGPARVRVEVEMDGATRPIWVVEARVRGAEEPDALVILGNHRDAWVYGAVDPSSGTATQLELARALGELVRRGHRPRRTIVLASWDAEEWHLTGSTEWGEQFADELRRSAVAYLNVDSSASGPEFAASAVASLNRLVAETVRDVVDPDLRRSVLEAWVRREGDGPAGLSPEELVEVGAGLVANELGSGSDYTVFLNFLGIPVVDMSFEGPYGVYHSQYDDHYWMSRFGDPGFRYMTVMAEIWGRMALRLANAEVLPFDHRLYAERVAGFVEELADLPGVEENLDLAAARAAVRDWAAAADRLRDRVAARLAAGRPAPAGLNELLARVERELLLEHGIPGRAWFRHALYAPRYTYAALSLPGVREAVEEGDWERARRQLGLLVERLGAVARAVAAAASAAAAP